MEYTGERFVPSQKGQIEMEHYNRYYFVIKQINLNGKVVVDLASGEGYGSALLANYAKEVIGIDISREAIENATSKYVRKNLSFLVGDAISIPLPDSSIDVFVSFETIEHLSRHNEMLMEIKRVLKNTGFCIISSPDKLNYSEIPGSKNEYHVKELYYDEFRELLTAYFNNIHFFNQRLFSGSIIALDEFPENRNQAYKKPILIEKNGTIMDFSPLYSIAICTDDLNFYPDNQLMLYQDSDRIIFLSDIDIIRGEFRKSLPFKIGKVILFPFKIGKSLFSAVFNILKF